jgi:nucleotide-binding universal stress UspA family protein
VVVARSSDASDDEVLAQAYDLAIAAVVDVKSCPIGNTNSEHIREGAAASGVGLVVLPGSLVATFEGRHRLHEAVASARPVLVAKSRFGGGPVMVVADAPRAGLGALAVAADEARRLARPLLVVHAAEGMVGVAKGELGPVSAMSLRACLETIRRHWGVAAETRAIDSPCVPALSSLADALSARLIVLGTWGGTGPDELARMQRMLDIARAAPCSVLLLPPSPDVNPRVAGRLQPAASLST